MLENLPGDATVYVQNENELAAVGATNNLRGLAANVKFISNGIVNGESKNVNGNILKSSRNQKKTVGELQVELIQLQRQKKKSD